MKISICVPLYGVEKRISKCAISLFEQTYEDIEYVFINDCTKDRSVDVLEKVIGNYPYRKDYVRIVNHEVNKGLAAARNTGIKESTGSFILWIDSDDSIDTSLVEKLVRKQEENDSDIVCYDLKVIFSDRIEYYRNGDYIDGKDLCAKMLRNAAPHQLCGHLIRKSLYTDNNIKAVAGVNQAEDLQVMPRLAYYSNRVSVLHEALYFYDRTSENSFSNNFDVNKSKQISFAEEILKSFFKDKETYLYEYLEFSIAQSLVRRLKWLSLLGNEVNEHYKELEDDLHRISPCVRKQLRFDLRFISMIKSKTIVFYITRITDFFYRAINLK